MGIKIPRPDKWFPKPKKPKIPTPKLPNVGSEIRKALDPVFKQIDSVRGEIENIDDRVQEGINNAINEVEKSVNTAIDEMEKSTSEIDEKVVALEKQIGDLVVDGLNDAFSELIDLAESGLMKEALGKIADIAEKEVFEGDAPITLRTAYLDIEVTDAKHLARTIRDMINDGLPTSKREWRYIIIDLAPKAIEFKPGIPLIAQLTKKIPLENLERKAMETILRKVGL